MSLGETALARSDHVEATRCFKEALPLFRQVGSVLGEANCILGFGDIARARSDEGQARSRYEEALQLYERIAEPYSIGETHRRLARVASTAEDRAAHVRAAREAWLQMDRPDLVQQLDDEFGPEPAAAEAGS